MLTIQPRINLFGKIRKYLFLICLIAFAISFFLKANYRSVEEINEAAYNEPVQTEVLAPYPISFEKDGFKYKLTPLYNYEINGLVLSRLIYDVWYSLKKTDSVFSVDLCIAWGDNLKSKVYQNKSLKFSQNMRFCWFKWSEPVPINENEIGNNHLVINSDEMDKIAKNILPGDQVKITGKLVNVEAVGVGLEENEKYNWQTSTNRDDTGAGACEVLYVENIEILSGGNPVMKKINTYSLYGIIALIIFEILNFFTFTIIEIRKSQN